MAKKKKVQSKSTEEILLALQSQINDLQTSLKDKDTKLAAIETKQTKLEIGQQKYGISDWAFYESGSEKGYKASHYVDIKSLIIPSNPF